MRSLTPKGFKPAGRVLWARSRDRAPSFIKPQKIRDRRRLQGIRYESKVQDHLLDLYPWYVANPWFEFKTAGCTGTRWAQADGLLLDPERGVCTIVEMKYQHTAASYYQLVKLYLPVVQAILHDNSWRFRLLEIVKWFDPAMPYPCEPHMCASVEDAPSEGVGVHIWKP